MPTTSLGIRYPASTNTPNVPQDIQNLASDVNGLIGPKGLSTLTPAGGWVQGTPAARFWKGVDGLVHMSGQLSNTSTFTPAGDLMATLPTGFRPTQDVLVPVFNSSTFAVTVRITSVGRVEAFRSASNQAIGANSGWALDSITFLGA